MVADDVAENPRAVIGGNNPPADEADFDVIDARIIYEAADYLRFRFGGLANLLVKRKGKRDMGFRHVLVYSLRGLVPSESMARILDINRKTMGENQQRPEAWANHDSEEGRAFDALLEHVSQAVYHHVSIKREEFESALGYWVEKDPELRRAERQMKEMIAAAEEAERAAEALEEKKRVRQAKAHAALLKARGYKDHAAVAAEHMGPRALAKSVSEACLAVLEKLAIARVKDSSARILTSALNPAGLKEALKLGLAFNAEPALSKCEDPRIGVKDLGVRVYHEAIGLGRVQKAKRARE